MMLFDLCMNISNKDTCVYLNISNINYKNLPCLKTSSVNTVAEYLM